MKRLITSILTFGILSLGLAGCAEKTTTKTETQTSTPNGKTTVTAEKEVKKSGENPPPVRQ
jgi:hypothetical protein